MTRYGGAVAACGLAGGMDLPTFSRALYFARVCAFYGIDSVMCPLPPPRKPLETAGNRPGPPRNWPP